MPKDPHDTTAALAQALDEETATWPIDLRSTEVTKSISAFISRWALENQAIHHKEHEIRVPGVDRRGQIDHVLAWPGFCLAVEVDRGNKTWSVRKLHTAATEGLDGLPTAALWIRWKGRLLGEVPSTVHRVGIYRALAADTGS